MTIETIKKIFNVILNRNPNDEEIERYVAKSKFTNFELQEIPSLKSSTKISQSELKKSEGQMIMKYLNSNDYVVLLDENGKSYSSIDFSNCL